MIPFHCHARHPANRRRGSLRQTGSLTLACSSVALIFTLALILHAPITLMLTPLAHTLHAHRLFLLILSLNLTIRGGARGLGFFRRCV